MANVQNFGVYDDKYNVQWISSIKVYTKKSIPITGLWGPEGSGRLRLPDSVKSALESGWLSALRNGRLYPQEYPGTHFKRLSRPRAHGIVGCHVNKSPLTPPGSIPVPSD
jgi:hypothetical protein